MAPPQFYRQVECVVAEPNPENGPVPALQEERAQNSENYCVLPSRTLHAVSKMRSHVSPLDPTPLSPAQSQHVVTHAPWPVSHDVQELVPTIVDGSPNTTQATESHIANPTLAFLKTSSSAESNYFSNRDEPLAKRRKLDVQWTSSPESADTHPAVALSQSSFPGAPHLSQPYCPPAALRSCGFVYSQLPPRTSALLDSIPAHGLLYKEYHDPHYSVSHDLPERPREYAGLVFDLTWGSGATYLPPWDVGESDKLAPLECVGVRGWEYAGWPPSHERIKKWLEKDKKYMNSAGVSGRNERTEKSHPQVCFPKKHLRVVSMFIVCQIEGQTQSNVYGFKETPDAQSDSARERQNMSVLSLEVFGTFSLFTFVSSSDALPPQPRPWEERFQIRAKTKSSPCSTAFKTSTWTQGTRQPSSPLSRIASMRAWRVMRGRSLSCRASWT